MALRDRYFYIMASGPRGTLYAGMTNDLQRRVAAHREGTGSEFTRRYKVNRLVYFEVTADVKAAIQRETQVKRWRRLWKIQLIERSNPEWRDLAEEWLGPIAGSDQSNDRGKT